MNQDKIPIGKAKNLENQKFYKLTALYRVANCNNRVAWKCECECGKTCIVLASNLINGKTKSCGCLRTKKNKEKIKNLVGQTFGKLTVIKDTGKRYKGKVIWLCECQCGNYKQILGDNLITGHSQSCGCLGKSKGEWKIEKILQENNISFQKEKKFQTCRDIHKLSFDFYVNNQYLIEFDGQQHFLYIQNKNNHSWNTKENFQKVKKHDLMKNEWCKENNIPLIRIPYTHYNNLSLKDLLLETSNFII